MKRLLTLSLALLIGLALAVPAMAQSDSLGTLISAFASPSPRNGIVPALWIRPDLTPVTTVQQVTLSDPLDELANDYARTQRTILRIRLFQSIGEQLNPQPPQRRSLFGLTTSGGAQGAVIGAGFGALVCHAGLFDPTQITTGTCVILGAIFGQ